MLKEQCNKNKLTLEYDHPEDFTLCVWQRKRRVRLWWAVFRCALWVAHFLSQIRLYFTPEKGVLWYKNILFWDTWVFLMQFSSYIISFIIVVKRYMLEKKNPEEPPLKKMPVLYKVLWYLYNVTTPYVLSLALFFWLLTFTPAEHPDMSYKIVAHALYPLYAVLDFAFSAVPYRLLHLYMGVLTCGVYGCFNVIYQLSGGTGTKGRIPIYPLMDWAKPLQAIGTGLSLLIGTALIHCGLCVFSNMKFYFRNKREEEED